jgi:hypothetical protein
MFGCSDDKSSGPSVTYGSLDDPEFAPVKVQIDDALDDLLYDILGGFDNLNAAPNDTVNIRAQLAPPASDPNEAEPDVIIMTYEGGWYYVYASYTGDVYESVSKDSIQFQVDGVPVEDPSDVDYVHFIDNWSFLAVNQDASHIDFTGRNDFQIADLDEQVCIINGTTVNNVEAVYIGVDTTAVATFAFDVTVTNLQISRVNTEWESSCPLTGTLVIDLDEGFEWTSGTSQGSAIVSWDIDVAFNDGSATVTATNGVSHWRYTTQLCEVVTN